MAKPKSLTERHQIRLAFEVWCVRDGAPPLNLERLPYGYASLATELSWRAWLGGTAYGDRRKAGGRYKQKTT